MINMEVKSCKRFSIFVKLMIKTFSNFFSNLITSTFYRTTKWQCFLPYSINYSKIEPMLQKWDTFRMPTAKKPKKKYKPKFNSTYCLAKEHGFFNILQEFSRTENVQSWFYSRFENENWHPFPVLSSMASQNNENYVKKRNRLKTLKVLLVKHLHCLKWDQNIFYLSYKNVPRVQYSDMN